MTNENEIVSLRFERVGNQTYLIGTFGDGEKYTISQTYHMSGQAMFHYPAQVFWDYWMAKMEIGCALMEEIKKRFSKQPVG